MEFEGPSFVEGGGKSSTAMPDNRDFSNPMYDMKSGAVAAAEAAVLAPSVVTHKTPPQPIRHRELNPVSIDTGKDTQHLVAEDDSEC